LIRRETEPYNNHANLFSILLPDSFVHDVIVTAVSDGGAVLIRSPATIPDITSSLRKNAEKFKGCFPVLEKRISSEQLNQPQGLDCVQIVSLWHSLLFRGLNHEQH
jgi:hypothetical protein